MGAASGPDMITDGLVLCLDAGSRASYSVTNILSYWTEYAGRAVHYEVLDAYSVKLKNTFNSWVGYYPATITSTGRYTITFTYYSDTNGSSLYLDNDGVMDNIYNNYTLTANIASQTYTASVDINTTGAINFYFMRFSGGNIFITDVNFYKSDTIWTDLAGSNNGTLTNGPTFSSANGGSIVFDGTNDYVQFSTVSVQTVCLWGRMDTDIPLLAALVATGSGVDLSLRTYPEIGTFWNSGNNADFQEGYGSSLMINGVSNLSSKINGSLIIPNGRNLFQDYYVGAIGNAKNISTISQSPLYEGRVYKGRVYAVYLYNRQLTNNELLQNYNATKGRFLL